MYIVDGIAYAGQLIDDIKIASVKVLDDMMMLLEFSTGEFRLYDASQLLVQEAFKPLADEKIFSDVTIEHGVVTWCDGEIDIAPESMYMNSYCYQRIT
ncbi:MAG: DUF2442 domain-containing protein [Proteobacteria bacterium]|nr:DUF2442 domain-containing protein [Pseudomonadota bacterium]